MTQVWVLSFTPGGLSLLPKQLTVAPGPRGHELGCTSTPCRNSERGAQLFQSSPPSGLLGPPIKGSVALSPQLPFSTRQH